MENVPIETEEAYFANHSGRRRVSVEQGAQLAYAAWAAAVNAVFGGAKSRDWDRLTEADKEVWTATAAWVRNNILALEGRAKDDITREIYRRQAAYVTDTEVDLVPPTIMAVYDPVTRILVACFDPHTDEEDEAELINLAPLGGQMALKWLTDRGLRRNGSKKGR